MMPWKTPLPVMLPATGSRLQFGHGDDAVEDAPTAGSRGRRSPLQFGHGDDAVEDPLLSSPLLSSPLGFNSATAMMPWKTRFGAAARDFAKASIRPRR